MTEELYRGLPTEQRNPRLRDLDMRTGLELVDLIHEQDRLALDAVGRAREAIAALVDLAVQSLGAGGRLIYIGAGTSGRVAALDAAECPPTFGVRPTRVVAVVAGGPRALRRAVEGAEDSRGDGRRAIRRLGPEPSDLVCGVSASGVTPFVLGGLAQARRRGCATALVTCGPAGHREQRADLVVALEVGPEAVAGSTRLKAGLATKAVLHTLTTATMVRLGRVHDNLMVDLRPTSRKLRRRAERIVTALTGLSPRRAAALLRRAADSPKLAAVMHHQDVSLGQARVLLRRNGGRLRGLVGGVPDGR